MKPIDLLGFGPKRFATKVDGMWLVTVVPPAMFKCGPGATISLTPDQYERYESWNQRGGLIQDILPELSPVQREILMTGIGPELFAKIAEDEDD